MSPNTHLQVPISKYLYDVRDLAMAVTRHSKRLSAASEGRINAGTAKKMLLLAEAVMRLRLERLQIVTPSAQLLITEARQIISSIRAVAKYVARTKPAFADHLARVSGPQRRSVAAVLLALETHAQLMREHPEVGPLTPVGTLSRADELADALRRHDAAVREEQVAAARVTLVYASTLKELDDLVRDTRALARLLFRNEPDIARTFAPPRPRRKPATSRVATEVDV